MMVKAFNTIFADSTWTRGKLDRDGRKLTTFIAGDNDPKRKSFTACEKNWIQSYRHRTSKKFEVS